MAAKNGPRGEIHAVGANGDPVVIRVSWKRGSTYLSLNGHEHLVHPSNLRRANGFAMEAVLVYHVSDPVYLPQ
jgi:hypothetical protein